MLRAVWERVTPALLCCSTSSLVHGPTSREPQFLPLPFPSQATSAWPLSKPCPPIFFSTWFLNRGQNTETFASNLKRLRLSIAVSVFLHTLCMHEVLLIYLKPICEFKSLQLHVNIDEQQSWTSTHALTFNLLQHLAHVNLTWFSRVLNVCVKAHLHQTSAQHIK